MSYFVYMLRCNDETFYVGCTNNLNRRLQEHNGSKKGAHYTKLRRPVLLVYQETYETLSQARKREIEIKSWKREQKMKLV